MIERTTPIKLLPLQEFVNMGALQEINRQLLHLIGLEMVVTASEESADLVSISVSVRDLRHLKGGAAFGEGKLCPFKHKVIDDMISERGEDRLQAFGSLEQPVTIQHVARKCHLS